MQENTVNVGMDMCVVVVKCHNLIMKYTNIQSRTFGKYQEQAVSQWKVRQELNVTETEVKCIKKMREFMLLGNTAETVQTNTW